jgi:hypothetical protein
MTDFLTRLVERVRGDAETVEPVLTPVLTGGPEAGADAWIPPAGLESDLGGPSESTRPSPEQAPTPRIDTGHVRSEAAVIVPAMPPSTADRRQADPRGGGVLRGASGSEVGPGRGAGAAQVPVQTKQPVPWTEVSAVASPSRDGQGAVPDRPGSDDTDRGGLGGLPGLTPVELKVPSDATGATGEGEKGNRIGAAIAQRAIRPEILVSQDYTGSADYDGSDRSSTASSEPSMVRVTIGRIDVRAVTRPAPAAPRPKPAHRPKLSLEDYLSQRERGER